MALGERLKGARERAGFTLSDVSTRCEIGESSLSEFENDKREPRLSQLEVLARLYRRSISFFLETGPVAPETVLWRQRPDSAEAAQIESHFPRFC